MWQNVAKWNELLKLPRRQISLVAKRIELQKLPKRQILWVAETSKKKGKFQVNLNKGLCLLFPGRTTDR